MKKIFSKKFYLFAILGILFLFILSAFLSYFLIFKKNKSLNEKKESKLYANISYIGGEAKRKKLGEVEFSVVKVNDLLSEGDSFKTDSKSKAVIEFDNGDIVRLSENTEVALKSIKLSSIEIILESGEIYSRVSKSSGNAFNVTAQNVKAEAMGTVFIFSSNQSASEVKLKVFESKVKLNFEERETIFAELKKVTVNTEEKSLKEEDLEEIDLNNEFVQWNNDKDKIIEKNIPVISISEPIDGVKTSNQLITIKGMISDESSLKKIVVNEIIYTNVDENGKGIDLKSKSFNIDVPLLNGVNTITVKVYDIYWNFSEKNIKVICEAKTAELIQPSAIIKKFYIKSISSPSAGKIYVKWEIIGYSTPNGFKVVKSTSANPVYPGNDYLYLSKSTDREVIWSDVPAGTYHIRVCVYNGDGSCGLYTEDKTVTVSASDESEYKVTLNWTSNGSSESYPTEINLTVSSPVKITQQFYGLIAVVEPATTKNGFKVCYSESPNPTYPSSTCFYVSSSTSNYTITGLMKGKTYHFRVGAYKIEGGGCEIYSNDVAVSIL